MGSNDAPERSLAWGILPSLLRYVRGLPDGAIAAIHPAVPTDDAHEFAFPLVAEEPGARLRFGGGIGITGHSGLLRLEIRGPELIRATAPAAADTWALTIADPYAPGARLEFATLERLDEDAAGTLRGVGTLLSADGADLFSAGPYHSGTPLADPVVRSVS